MEKKRAVILFADIQGSTEFGHTQSVENYNVMLRDYHRTAQAAVKDYCEKYGLDLARLTCSGKGDECCIFIIDGKPGEDEEHALRLAVYLKERWKQSDFVVRMQKAAETGLIPQVDLRIGIGSGDVAWDQDCWTGKDTFEGIVISQAKRIEGMAHEAAETLIMISWEVKEACQKASVDVQFGDGRKLAGKGIPNWLNLPVYTVTKYGDWVKVQQAVPKAPEKPEWARRFDEAFALANSGKYDQAITSYRKALELRPDLPEAWNNLGFAYGCKGEHDQAIAAHQRALELRPDDPVVWNNLGIDYWRKGDYERAMEAYRKALALRSDYPEAWNNLGVAYYCTKDYEQAMEAYQRALGLRPDLPEARYGLGLVSYLRGDHAQALRSYQEADRLKPRPASQAYSWACLYSLMGKAREALKHLRRAIELDSVKRLNARTDPDFGPIRDLPSFRRLVGIVDKK